MRNCIVRRAKRPALIFRLAVLGVLFLALWVRVSRFPSVFVDGAVVPVGQDSAYHLRRILHLVSSGGELLVRDPHMNWPHGGLCHWAPGFDELGAFLIRAAGAPADSELAAAVAALEPLLLGLFTTGAVMGLVLMLLGAPRGRWAAIAAGVVIALLPQSVSIGRLGRIDHHVAEALFAALLGVWALAPRGDLRARAAGEIAGFFVVTASVYTFAGNVLYVAIASAMVTLATLERTRSGLLGSGAPALAVAAVALFLFFDPLVETHGQPWSYIFPSYLYSLLLAVAAAGALAAAASTWLARGVVRRALLAATLLAAVVGAVSLAAPQWVEAVRAGAVGFVGRQNEWLAMIDEFQPLFTGGWSRARDSFGLLGYVLPIVAAAGIAVAVLEDRRRGASFGIWTIALLALTLWQHRFGRPFTVPLAVATGLALHGLARLAGGRMAAIPLALLVLIAADERLRAYAPIPPAVPPAPLDAAALYLRAHAPPVAHGARSGVLTTWDMGHMILGVGRRPVIAAGFGPWDGGTGYAEETAIWSRGERDLYALMDRRDLGWVAAGAATFHQRYAGPDGGDPFMPGADGRGALNLAYFRALPLAALTLGGSGLADAGIRHLGELRPVFAGEQGVDNLAFYLPRLFLFERVRGVRLTGEAPPETRVIARAEIPPRLPYEAWTDSGQDGRWEIVFPVASETVRVAGVVVRVGESDVREGRIIAVPKSH